MTRIYNGDCLKVLGQIEDRFDLVVTSPPYGGNVRVRKNNTKTYDIYDDSINVKNYNEKMVSLFGLFDKVLKKDGVVLWNVSYNKWCSEQFVLCISDIISKTNFTIGDVIVWKKTNCVPIPDSMNKLNRICEFVFVLVRREDFDTYHCNKPITSTFRGRNKYGNMFNFIEAKNNDGACKLNAATFSTEFVSQLLEMYCPANANVLDPFFGTGTTGSACKKIGALCTGIEISEAQCEFAKKRLDDLFNKTEILKIQ